MANDQDLASRGGADDCPYDLRFTVTVPSISLMDIFLHVMEAPSALLPAGVWSAGSMSRRVDGADTSG